MIASGVRAAVLLGNVWCDQEVCDARIEVGLRPDMIGRARKLFEIYMRMLVKWENYLAPAMNRTEEKERKKERKVYFDTTSTNLYQK